MRKYILFHTAQRLSPIINSPSLQSLSHTKSQLQAMSMRKTYSRVQSFPSLESDALSPLSNQFDQLFAHKFEDLHQLQRSRISADRLSKILNASIVAQKMGMRLAMKAISPTTGSNSDWKFINCYLDSSVLLLDACNSVHLRLENIRSCLNSILIGLHYLEGEHEPSRAVMQRVATSFDFSHFEEKHRRSKMEKSMSRLRTFGRKLSGHTLTYKDTADSISPELYKALTGSWTMAVLAVEVLGSATSFRPLERPCVEPARAEPWTMLFNELSHKMKVLPKKSNETASMQELADAYLAAHALLKLLSPLEENIIELYKNIVALRINLLGILSKAQKEDVLEIVKPYSCEESQMDANPEKYQRSVTWVKVKTKRTTRSCSLIRIRPRCIGFIKRKTVKRILCTFKM